MEDAFSIQVPTKKPKVSVVMDDLLKTALEEWAEKESRTVSNLCELILREAAETSGYLKSADTK